MSRTSRKSKRHQTATKQHRQLLALSLDWDGRGALAPTGDAIDVAETVLAIARKTELEEIRVTPDVEGGVAVYFFGGTLMPDGGWTLQAGILVDNDGEAVMYLRDRQETGSTFENIDITVDALCPVIDQILRFINGDPADLRSSQTGEMFEESRDLDNQSHDDDEDECSARGEVPVPWMCVWQ